MAENTDETSILESLQNIFPYLETGLYERQKELRACFLAALAGESVFFLGPPGTAKSMIARRLSLAFDKAHSFDYLMGRFSTPEEIFGPLSIHELKEHDRLRRQTEGYLPKAEIVFLDEIWKASPPIQNSLLTALNERIFRNGDIEEKLPLTLLLAASNEGPDSENSLAFWDRFLLRFYVAPLKNPHNFRQLLEENSQDCFVPQDKKISQSTWQKWMQRVDSVRLDSLSLNLLLELRHLMNMDFQQGEGPYISDRRWKKIARLLRASALCHNRQESCLADTPLILDALWHEPAQYDRVKENWKKALAKADPSSQKLYEEVQALMQNLSSLARPAKLRGPAWQNTLELVDGEYALLEAKDPALDRLLQEDHLEIRLWIQDIPETESRESRGEFFLYKAGEFLESCESKSLRDQVNLKLEAGLDFPQAPYLKLKPLELRLRTRPDLENPSQDQASVSASGQEGEKAQTLASALENRLGELSQILQKTQEAAREHLFLSASLKEECYEVLPKSLEILSQAKADLASRF